MPAESEAASRFGTISNIFDFFARTHNEIVRKIAYLRQDLPAKIHTCRSKHRTCVGRDVSVSFVNGRADIASRGPMLARGRRGRIGLGRAHVRWAGSGRHAGVGSGGGDGSGDGRLTCKHAAGGWPGDGGVGRVGTHVCMQMFPPQQPRRRRAAPLGALHLAAPSGAWLLGHAHTCPSMPMHATYMHTRAQTCPVTNP
jgi:hypothetical protein